MKDWDKIHGDRHRVLIRNAILTDKLADIPSKPRTALLQGEGNDEKVKDPSTAAAITESILIYTSSASESSCMDMEIAGNNYVNDYDIQFGTISTKILEADQKLVVTATSCKALFKGTNLHQNEATLCKERDDNVLVPPDKDDSSWRKDVYQLGSLSFNGNCCNDTKKEDMNIASSIPCNSKIKHIGATEVTPKLRTALIQGKENDEPMAHQISSVGDPHLSCNNSWNEDGHSKESSIIQFGVLPISLTECIKRENYLSCGNLYPWCKKIFVGTNLKEKHKQQEKSTAYIMVGSMRVC